MKWIPHTANFERADFDGVRGVEFKPALRLDALPIQESEVLTG